MSGIRSACNRPKVRHAGARATGASSWSPDAERAAYQAEKTRRRAARKAGRKAGRK